MSFSHTKKIALCILSLLSLDAFADPNAHAYVSGDVGMSRLTLRRSIPQVSYVNNLVTDSYPIHTDQVGTALLGLQAGYEWEGKGNIPSFSLGMGFYRTPSYYKVNGSVFETALGGPSSRLYTYRYEIISTRLMLEAQATWPIDELIPFINIGMGPTWTSSQHYRETPVDNNGFVALPPYNDRTHGRWSFQFGVGAAYGFNYKAKSKDTFKHERIAVGYRFVNLGSLALESRGPLYPYSADFGSLRSNDFYISYTHLF